MHTSAKGAAAHTAADLDAMDDKLRRLGLDVDHVGEVAAAAKTQSSDDYLRRIRTAKAEKQQAQRDRVARQAVTAEKHLSVHPSAASGNRSSGAQPTEETLAADKALLASDTAEAAVRAQQDYQKSTTQQIRAERMLHAAQEPPPQSTRHTSTVGSFAGNMAAGSPGASAIAISVKDTMPWSASAVARADAKRRAVAPWCGGIAQGIIELAIEMSDHRHLPATGLAGRPVYRLQQDLGVTQWRDAVEQHVFARAAVAEAAAEAETRTAEATRDGRCARGSVSTNLTAAAPSASVLAAAEDTALHLEASRCIEMAARAAAEEAAQAQQRAVAAVLSKLQVEVARQRKAAEEVVRREADEAPTGEALTLNPSVVGGQREEVLPGWAQRMPPAGCFVYGDDLSGARLLSDTIELCMQRSFYLTQQAAAATTRQSHHSTHAPPAAPPTVLSAAAATDSADNSHRGPAGDVLEAGVSNVSFGKPSPPKDPLAHFTASEIGVESGEGGEGGVAVTYITPKTLMGGVAMANLGSDSRRTGSASRGARAQTHGSPTSGAPAISPSGAASTASGAGGGGASGAGGGGGGGGGSAVRSGRRASAAASDGRRGMEQQLAEAAVREIVRVHRHNLGVLVGDKIPAWSRVTATPSAGDTEESEHDAVRAPLQALVLVGFPDTASFAEVLAERLRNATAAAEVELLELEARRRAAEHQAVASAAATETTKPRSPSTKSAKGAAAPSRQKTKGSPKTAVEAEECAVTSVTEQLRALFALPPLSVLSVFLSYDVPTRQQRLEDAAFAAEPPPSTLRGMSDSNEDDIVATLAAGGPGCEFMHPIFHPWRVEEKEVVEPSRTGSFRRPVGGAAAAAVAASTPVLAFATTATPPHGFARSLDVWSVPTLRAELEQQDARQHLQRQAWTGAVASAFGRKAREMASAGADLRRVPASFYAAGKRRDKQLPGSAAQDGDRSVQASRLTSITTTTPGKVAADGAAFPGSPLGLPPAATADGAAKLSAPQLLPRAIFFARVLDVSDVTAPMPLSEDAGAPADSQALGHAVWRFSVTSTAAASNNAGGATAALSSDGLPDLLHMTARAATVDRILTQLHLLCRPAGGRALSSDLLVPHQLPEPFRLGDYRLADALCVRLRQVHEVYSSLLPDPASVQRVDRGAARQDGDAVSGVTVVALQAETEAWGAVLQYAEGLYSLVARNVFADGTAGAEAGAAHAGDEKARFVMTAGTMNSTARFTNIDRGYANVKDAIAQHTSRAVTRIQDCLALLLRLSVDVYVAQLAAMVRLFCTLLDRPSQAKAGGHIGFACLPPSTLVDSEIEGAFMSAVPRLPEGAARSLVAQLLHQPHPQPIDDTRAREAARDGFCATLDRTYWAAVKAAAVEVLTGYFARRAKDVQLAESSAVAADGTPSWDDVCETPHAAVRPAALNIPAENLSAVAALLLEHATTAPPVPLSRLALLLQEFQCKARALHDGADAWVEKLYHDVLAAQPGRAAEAPQQQQPQQQHQRRPQSIDELADGPQAVLAAAGTSGPLASVNAATAVRGLAHADPAAELPSPSRWRCGELELFLASMPQPDHYGAVTTTSFQRGLLMNQLPRLWRFLPDCTPALAEQVGYAVTAVDAVVQQRGRRASSSSPSAHGAVLPDTALDAYLVHDCPCKHTAAASVAVPFLTVENVLRLAALAAGEGGPVVTASAVAAASAVSVGNVAPPVRAPLMHLRRWLIELALGRCCFCAHGAACAAHAARSLATGHATGARAAMRRFVPPPSSRALRQTLLSLPPAVLEQAASLSTVHTIPIGLMTPLPPLSAQMVAGWVQAQWWWETDGGEDDEGEEQSDAGARRDVALCWTLWRVLLRPSLYTDGEGKTAASSAAVAAVPSLISLLRLLLIGAPGEGNPLEERVRRAFHCLAALRGVREGRTEASMSVKDGDAAVAMAIEDDMALTREEYTLLGDLLTVPMSPMAPEAAPWGGMQTTRGVADLVTDVQLLLQVEGTERVTLPLLLSSRWAQLLLAAHF